MDSDVLEPENSDNKLKKDDQSIEDELEAEIKIPNGSSEVAKVIIASSPKGVESTAALENVWENIRKDLTSTYEEELAEDEEIESLLDTSGNENLNSTNEEEFLTMDELTEHEEEEPPDWKQKTVVEEETDLELAKDESKGLEPLKECVILSDEDSDCENGAGKIIVPTMHKKSDCEDSNATGDNQRTSNDNSSDVPVLDTLKGGAEIKDQDTNVEQGLLSVSELNNEMDPMEEDTNKESMEGVSDELSMTSVSESMKEANNSGNISPVKKQETSSVGPENNLGVDKGDNEEELDAKVDKQPEVFSSPCQKSDKSQESLHLQLTPGGTEDDLESLGSADEAEEDLLLNEDLDDESVGDTESLKDEELENRLLSPAGVELLDEDEKEDCGSRASTLHEDINETPKIKRSLDLDKESDELDAPAKRAKLKEDDEDDTNKDEVESKADKESVVDDDNDTMNTPAENDQNECKSPPGSDVKIVVKEEDGDEAAANDVKDDKSDVKNSVVKTEKDDAVLPTKLMVLSKAQLEEYVAKKIKENLESQSNSKLLSMEQKCDTLRKALDRWRRRAFQLQKQLNEFICEQEKCTSNNRKGKVLQRSVGVCVRMPPAGQKVGPPMSRPMPMGRNTMLTKTPSPNMTVVPSGLSLGRQFPTSGGVMAQGKSPLSQQNSAIAKVLGSPLLNQQQVTSRHPSQIQVSTTGVSASSVPMQLINSATGSPIRMKAPTASQGGTVVRAVTMVPTSLSTVGAAVAGPGVKVIDLTQEEDGGSSAKALAASGVTLQKVMSTSGGAVSGGGKPGPGVPSGVQKITVPTSVVPVLSGTPTSMVQVTPLPGAVHQAGVPRPGTTIRVAQPGSTTLMAPGTVPGGARVTYLVPSMPPGLMVSSREAPRMGSQPMSIVTTPPGQMQTILLRMSQPGVQGSTISMNAIPQTATAQSLLVTTPVTPSMKTIRAPVAPVQKTPAQTTPSVPGSVTMTRIPGPGNQQGAKPMPPASVQRAETTTTSSSVTITSVGKHPAPLPPQPMYLDDPNRKPLPPKPVLRISRAQNANGIVLSWNINGNPVHADIQTYQLYAYQEGNGPPTTSLWKKVGDVRALPLPMACTLTQFVEGHKYHFAVRAVDIHNRMGPFSEPASILLSPGATK